MQFFWKRMNCDIDKFSTNVRKITESNFLGYFGQFVVCLNSLWIARIVCGSSGQFVDCPDSLWIVRTVSLPIQQCWAKICLVAKTFRICKNFPDSNATTLPWFFWLCFVRTWPKLSQRLAIYFFCDIQFGLQGGRSSMFLCLMVATRRRWCCFDWSCEV